MIAKTNIQFSESFEVDGPEMFTHACKIGLEGVVDLNAYVYRPLRRNLARTRAASYSSARRRLRRRPVRGRPTVNFRA
jgi:ATP-dependent DNA ligase